VYPPDPLGGEYQEKKLLFQIAHPAEEDFILLQGVLLVGSDQLQPAGCVGCPAAAAGIFTGIGMADREQDVVHIVEAEEDPLGQSDAQRLQADLAIRAAHRGFERCQAAHGLECWPLPKKAQRRTRHNTGQSPLAAVGH